MGMKRRLITGFSVGVTLLLTTAFGGGVAVASETPSTEEGTTIATPPPRDEPLSANAVAYLEGDLIAPYGALCDTGIICGTIKNSGSVTFTAATDYISSTQVASNAKKTTVAPGQRAQGSGPSYDWDAYWVPAGYCGSLWGGPSWNTKSTMNRVGQSSGRWDAVDDWGGQVKLAKGYCPS